MVFLLHTRQVFLPHLKSGQGFLFCFVFVERGEENGWISFFFSFVFFVFLSLIFSFSILLQLFWMIEEFDWQHLKMMISFCGLGVLSQITSKHLLLILFQMNLIFFQF